MDKDIVNKRRVSWFQKNIRRPLRTRINKYSIEKFEASIASGKNKDIMTYYWLGKLYYERGDYGKTIANFWTYLRERPGDTKVLSDLVHIVFEEKKFPLKDLPPREFPTDKEADGRIFLALSYLCCAYYTKYEDKNFVEMGLKAFEKYKKYGNVAETPLFNNLISLASEVMREESKEKFLQFTQDIMEAREEVVALLKDGESWEKEEAADKGNA